MKVLAKKIIQNIVKIAGYENGKNHIEEERGM